MIKTLQTRFNSLTNREQLIFLATLLILIWSVWDNLVYQPITNQTKQYATELKKLNNNISTYQQTMLEIERVGKLDPNLSNKTKLKQLNARVKKLTSQLGKGEKKFVSANKMATLLTDMLNQNNGLKLVGLETLPATTLSQSEQQSWVYRHGLSLTLQGNFKDTVSYLKSLESLPWRFSWDSIDYQVKQYPVAETTLRLYTLSFEENWLGL
jgi:MSHA biogenesis protein MshJ